jgi:hypothetical protein
METNLPTPMTGRVELLIWRVNHDEFSKKKPKCCGNNPWVFCGKNGFSVGKKWLFCGNQHFSGFSWVQKAQQISI